MGIAKIKVAGIGFAAAAAIGGAVYQYRNYCGVVSSSATLDLCAHCLCQVQLQSIQLAVTVNACACLSDLLVSLYCLSIDSTRLSGRHAVAAR